MRLRPEDDLSKAAVDCRSRPKETAAATAATQGVPTAVMRERRGGDAKLSTASREAGPDLIWNLLIFKCWQLIQKFKQQNRIGQTKHLSRLDFNQIRGNPWKDRRTRGEGWGYLSPDGSSELRANSPLKHCWAGTWPSVFGFLHFYA